MPTFEDSLGREAPTRQEAQGAATRPIPIAAPPMEASLARRLSEESIRTELCEGPLPDSPCPPALRTPEREGQAAISDRAELIERLKRGESPTWIPNRHLETLYRNETTSPVRSPSRPRSKGSPSSLLPPASITIDRQEARPEETQADEVRLREGLTIERPRSALHSGDFTQLEEPPSNRGDEKLHETGRLDLAASSHPPDPHVWIATSPPRGFDPAHFAWNSPLPRQADDFRSGVSSLSSSLSSSFVYKPPTSPLVQSLSNDDLDLSLPMNNIDITAHSPADRRHTLHFSHAPGHGLEALRRTSSLRREGPYPYQAHQPRRSLTSTPTFSLPGSSPQTPFLRPRRPSVSADVSPLQHASMVGSYEESILRGRMSTTPSKPLDFMAQIGVLGLGKCKASLRCPAHVTLPFSAVFYSYANTPVGRSKSDDGPSPYVGQIDLENGLASPEEELRARRRLQGRQPHPERGPADAGLDVDMGGAAADGSDPERRRPKRQKRGPGSARAPPGGSYRVPEKGQLQIIIKNQNKTAVKLFLVPYDLAGMEPGTKTFIRQRSYSAGPIIDNIPPPREGGGGGAAAAAAAADRPILRYLVHLHICCPARGRYYLYKSIRVVFANRVPDGKERLRNEVTLPEPRYSPYRPVRVMHPPVSASHPAGPGAALAADKASRRRSAGFSFGGQHLGGGGGGGVGGFDAAEPLPLLLPPPPPPHSLHAALSAAARPSPGYLFGGGGGGGGGTNIPVEPIPFRLPSAAVPTTAGSLGAVRAGRASAPGQLLASSPADSSSQATSSRPATQDSAVEGGGGGGGGGSASQQQQQQQQQWQQGRPSPPLWSEGMSGVDARWDKLSRGDAGYGGRPGAGALAGRGGPLGAAEGLLSQRLRSLGVRTGGGEAAAAAEDEDEGGRDA